MNACPDCAAPHWQRFENETQEVEHAGRKTTVPGLSGKRCASCGETLFDDESARRYAAAGDELVLAERKSVGAELRRIRKKLGLTQQQAAILTGGGHNAFSRYEKGLIPVAAVRNLFRLLDRHPELVAELDLAGNDNETLRRVRERA